MFILHFKAFIFCGTWRRETFLRAPGSMKNNFNNHFD